MKKVLCLSLLTCSIFSMQLDIIKSNCSKIKNIHHKLVKQHSAKQHFLKKDDKKQPIKSSSFFAHKGLGSVELYHNNNGFHVSHNDKMHYVQPCFTDSTVRNRTSQQMKDFQRAEKAYLHIKQMGDGQFSLEMMDRVRGGGPVLGVMAYWTTKILCYSVGIVAVSATVAVTTPVLVAGVSGIVGGTGATTMVVGATSSIAGFAAEGAIATVAGASSLTAGTIAGTMAATGTAITAATAGTVAATGATIIGTTAGGLAAGLGTAGVITGGTGLVAAGTAGAVIGGATVGGIAVGEAAALTTAVVVGHATSTAGAVGGATLIVGGIEAFAATVGTFFGMLPTI